MVDQIQFINVIDFGIFLRDKTEFSNNPSLQKIINGTNSLLNGCSCNGKSLINSLKEVYKKLGETLTEEDKQNIKRLLNTNDVILSLDQTVIIRF